MKPKTHIVLMLLSSAGLIISFILIELSGGVKNRTIYAPLALVASLNLISLALAVLKKRSP